MQTASSECMKVSNPRDDKCKNAKTIAMHEKSMDRWVADAPPLRARKKEGIKSYMSRATVEGALRHLHQITQTEK